MIYEPDVVFTDYILFFESIILAFLLNRIKTKKIQLKKAAFYFYIFLGVASLIGGTVHGFFPDKNVFAAASIAIN